MGRKEEGLDWYGRKERLDWYGEEKEVRLV